MKGCDGECLVYLYHLKLRIKQMYLFMSLCHSVCDCARVCVCVRLFLCVCVSD